MSWQLLVRPDRTTTMTVLAGAYLAAAAAAADLLATAAVAEKWDEPSALATFSVRGLAGHLGAQVLTVAEVLGGQIRADVEPVTLDEHYRRARWRGADVNDPVNVGIRRRGEARSANGPAALVAVIHAAIDDLRTALPAIDGQRPVLLPWAGWALTVDDFLITRMLETAVHSDDLAVSVGTPTPEDADDVGRRDHQESPSGTAEQATTDSPRNNRTIGTSRFSRTLAARPSRPPTRPGISSMHRGLDRQRRR